MTEHPDNDRKEQRKVALKNLGWAILAVFILLVFLYPEAFRG